MSNRKSVAVLACVPVLLGLAGLVTLRGADTAPLPRPKVAGEWTGKWAVYAPPKEGEKLPPDKHTKEQLRLDCKVVELADGTWQATFEGECGRPYKYVVKMQGRQGGPAVLFKGSADLGEKDGGVFDWIGRATDEEFVGFFSSPKYTGHFRLARIGKVNPK